MKFLSQFVLILTTIICCLHTNAQPPNVVFILADDLGYGDLGCYGHRFIKTPNLDRLAAEGIKFTDFYAPSPLCSPSRAGVLTGRTPYRTGIKSWIPEDDDIYLTSNEITIASVLRENGYHTFFGGKWHLNGGLENQSHPQPQHHGFDYWLGTHNFTLPTHKDPNNFYRNGKALGQLKGFAARIVVDEAIGWMDTVSRAQPFLMYISLHEPHSEIASPDSFNIYYREFTKKPIDLEHLEDRGPGEYYANISHLDHQVGRLLNALDKNGLASNTMVIFTSDNGPVTDQWRYWWEVNMYGETAGLRGRKADLFEGGIRVPCIIRFPGVVEPGIESEVPLIGYDFLPTLCGLTGMEVPPNRVLDGLDFSPLFQGQSITRDKPLFWAFHTRRFDDPAGYLYAVRQGPWKMIVDERLQAPLLYNIQLDPHEVREVSAEYPEKVSELIAFISKMATSIAEDPLRPEHGPQSKE
jgi:arylsulfatase A-like enzyme